MADRTVRPATTPLFQRTPEPAAPAQAAKRKPTARTFYLQHETIQALDTWVRAEWARTGRKPSASDFVNRAIMQAVQATST